MGRPLGEQAVVVGVVALTPAGRGVVAGLAGQDGFLVVERDFALGVMVLFAVRLGHPEKGRAAGYRLTMATPDELGYSGPPPTQPPSDQWHPPVLYQTQPPRTLPYQAHDQIDAGESQARLVTYGVAIAAGAVLILLLFVLCTRIVV